MFTQKINTLTIVSAILFFSISFIYFLNFTIHYDLWGNFPENSNFFYYPLNTDFAKLLMPALENLINIRDNNGLSFNDIVNNKYYAEEIKALNNETLYSYRGVQQAGIYYFYSVFVILYLDNFTYGILGLSFVLNSLLVVFSYNFFYKILNHVSINNSYSHLFFLNPILIWYSQGLNKEIIIITLILGFIYFFLKKNKIKLVFIICLIYLIRWQLLLALPIVYIFFKFKNKGLIILGAYIFTSILATYIYHQSSGIITSDYSSLKKDYITVHSINTGLSTLIFDINNNYYVGNLIFNPIRAIQYFYDQIRTLAFYNINNKIDLYYLSNIFINLYLLFNIKTLFRIITNYKHYAYAPLGIIVYLLISMFLVILISPIIQARYLAPMLYPIVILIIYSKKNLSNN